MSALDIRGMGGEPIISAGETSDLVRKAEELGVALLEFAPPANSNIETLVRFRQAYPETPVLVVAATDDREHILAAFDAGACGYVCRSAARSVVAAAVRLVSATPAAEFASVTSSIALTSRQLEVLHLAAKGLANKNIAQRLKVTEDTVKAHLRTAYAKLGVGSRTQALAAAARLGIKL